MTLTIAKISHALNALGEIHEREVAMAPARHHSYGLIGPDKTPVITLPSDSRGAYVSCEIFVRPMIRQMLGRKNLSHRINSAILDGELTFNAGVRTYVEAIITHESNTLRVRAATDVDRAEANGFIVVDEANTSLRGGSEVSVMLVDRRAE